MSSHPHRSGDSKLITHSQQPNEVAIVDDIILAEPLKTNKVKDSIQ